MNHPPPRGMVVAAAIAVPLHLLLFVLSRPPSVDADAAVVPPLTRYLFPAEGHPLSAEVGSDVRMIFSPVVFSLPVNMGFSGELKQDDVRTSLSFSKKESSERFLELKMSKVGSVAALDAHRLMLTAGRSLPVPTPLFYSPAPRETASEFFLSANLEDRLREPVAFSAVPAAVGENPLEVHAALSVSEEGVVQHVFLDHPLESAAETHQVLRFLYELPFTPGVAVEGGVELYSPGVVRGGGEK